MQENKYVTPRNEEAASKTPILPLLRELDPSSPRLDSTLHGALHGAAGYWRGQYILADTSHSLGESNCEPRCAPHMNSHMKRGKEGERITPVNYF